MKLEMNWTDRKMKVFERQAFFEGVGPKYYYLTLPGSQCIDIETGENLKVLHPMKTRITAVEREAEAFASMCQWFAVNWRQEKKRLIHGELCSISNLGPLDLVFLDYLGNPTHADAFWIKNHLAEALLPDAHLGITVTKTYRNNTLYPAVRNLIMNHFHAYYLNKFRYIRDSGDYHKHLLQLLTVYYIMFGCYLFPDHACKIAVDYYAERTSPNIMVLFKLIGMQRAGRCLTAEEQQIHDAIDSIVRSRDKGVKIVTVAIPMGHVLTRREPQQLLAKPCKKENVMSVVAEKLRGKDVVDALLNAKSAGTKAAATKKLRKYVAQREADGLKPSMVEAGIKARVKRVQNGNV